VQLGACAGATASCQGTSGWVCSYGSDVQLKSCTSNPECGTVPCTGGFCPGIIALNETRCDGKDNNCNGLVDEPFPDKGKPCLEPGKLGICQGSGTWVCNAGGTATECNVTTPGLPKTDELCNGKDDDCDGVVDEEGDDAAGMGVVDAMVQIPGMAGKYVYAYEASRPDAAAGVQGTSTSRACSKLGVQPWSNVTWSQASAACVAAGKRLCSADEWYAACRTSAGYVYPYGSAYQAGTCNGLDRAYGGPWNTGYSNPPACVGGGVYDMSGNVKEWTAQSPSAGAHTVRGGAYDSIWSGLRCDFTFTVLPDTFLYPNLGFRCCSDSPP
jgi:hypothetical protein